MLLPRVWLVLLASTAALVSLLSPSSVSVDALPLGFFNAHPKALDRELRLQPHDYHHKAEAPEAKSLDAIQQIQSKSSESSQDEDHAYFRPSGNDVSGFPKNSAPYHRSPCPCMNSLANHGYIPRDGKNLTPELLIQAVVKVFNLEEALAKTITSTLPPHLTLADLGVHNFIEHDASMVHDDSFLGNDPSQINTTLVKELLARANKNEQLTKKEIAHWRHDREKECAKTNPQYDFGLKRQAGAYAEAAAFLIAMGEYATESISVDHAKSFLLMEQIPNNFEKSKVQVTTVHALIVAAKIKAMASFPWELLSAY